MRRDITRARVLIIKGKIKRMGCLRDVINCDNCIYRANNFCTLLKVRGLDIGYLTIKRVVR